MRRKDKIGLTITSLALTIGHPPFSGTDFDKYNYVSSDEYSQVQTIQASNESNRTDYEAAETTRNAQIIASFEKGEALIRMMGSAISSESETSELDDRIKANLEDMSVLSNTLDFIEASGNDEWLVLLSKMYLNLVPDRSLGIIVRLIDKCMNSGDFAVNSFGIDLLSLYSSYRECRRFLERSFSHPFLKRKMNSLIGEARV